MYLSVVFRFLYPDALPILTTFVPEFTASVIEVCFGECGVVRGIPALPLMGGYYLLVTRSSQSIEIAGIVAFGGAF